MLHVRSQGLSGAARSNDLPRSGAARSNDLLRSRGFAFRGSRSVDLELGEVLQSPGQRMRSVWFPEGSVVSLIVPPLQTGDRAVEAGLIGSEGMDGVTLALGETRARHQMLVQGSGRAQHASSELFLEELAQSPGLRRRVLRYSGRLTAIVMQTLACNRNHGLVARLATWLLMMRERSALEPLELTQQFLCDMLGVRRSGVSEAATQLQRLRVIRYTRGRLEIIDIDALRRVACRCHMLPRGA